VFILSETVINYRKVIFVKFHIALFMVTLATVLPSGCGGGGSEVVVPIESYEKDGSKSLSQGLADIQQRVKEGKKRVDSGK